MGIMHFFKFLIGYKPYRCAQEITGRFYEETVTVVSCACSAGCVLCDIGHTLVVNTILLLAGFPFPSLTLRLPVSGYA